MHIKDHDLVLDLSELDHVMGDPKRLGEHLTNTARFWSMTGSEAFMDLLDQSDELFMAGLVPDEDQSPILDQLNRLGVTRVCIMVPKPKKKMDPSWAKGE